ncbi:hypothetical protein G6F64_014863 [Rhizopus arrhizus]|uniref:Uncharacterized protein n=1 Tax=Rhizopus oryzae TaxID=64495 RepID=A0A9P6WTE2_RHIOR|nr:hypothetical protein G6F64_014863 [Rhizopus arrhizus]
MAWFWASSAFQTSSLRLASVSPEVITTMHGNGQAWPTSKAASTRLPTSDCTATAGLTPMTLTSSAPRLPCLSTTPFNTTSAVLPSAWDASVLPFKPAMSLMPESSRTISE